MFEFGDKLPNGSTVIRYADLIVLAYFNEQFVTWRCDNEGNTYSGHYFGDDIEAAGADFKKRCAY